MDETALYKKIVEDIRQKILDGSLTPGSRLPPIRDLTREWNCNPGTIQRAYRELARLGLTSGRPGQGTHVTGIPDNRQDAALRRVSLVHKAESYLLEAITAGYSLDEVEKAVRIAVDRWRVEDHEEHARPPDTIRFIGSHDLFLGWLAAHFADITDGSSLKLSYTGSLGGLIALAEEKADLAGSHLWDEETDTYNDAFVRRVLPGRRIEIITLGRRMLGLIVPPGNPLGLTGLQGLANPAVRFINRQAGSGTRVWLDAQLRRSNISPASINGYAQEADTHSDVARAIAEGAANAGFGLQTAAQAYGLDFIFLTSEPYEFIIPEEKLGIPAIRQLADWLQSPEARRVVESFNGYDASVTGQRRTIL